MGRKVTQMTRTVIYSRFSSDAQNDSDVTGSIQQQERLLRDRAAKEGWEIVEEFCDRAMSGSNTMRPGLQNMLAAVERQRIDVVLTESIDRLSRNLGDIGKMYERFRYLGVRIVTLIEGEIGELEIGMKGTFSAVYLRDLSRRTRRGMEQAALAGESSGGLSYGYDLERRFDEKRGRRIGGIRSVNPIHASVINRIFERFAAGQSPRRIAFDLNAEGIPGPRGGKWAATTIYGNRRRHTGIINNRLYIGHQVFGKQSFVRNPDTGRENGRMNDESTWVHADVPHLRIVSDELWEAVQNRLTTLTDEKHFSERRRPTHLLSFLLKCGVCGGGYSLVSSKHYGCSSARNKGPTVCANKLTIKQEFLEQTVLGALRNRLLNPELCKRFCEKYVERINRKRTTEGAARKGNIAEVESIERSVAKLIEAIAKGIDPTLVKDKIDTLQARKAALSSAISSIETTPVFVHPNMAEHYHQGIQKLIALLQDPEHREASSERLRMLIEKIVLTPAPDGRELRISLHGRLAEILRLAAGFGVGTGEGVGLSALENAELEQVMMVIGGDDLSHQPDSRESWNQAAPANHSYGYGLTDHFRSRRNRWLLASPAESRTSRLSCIRPRGC